MGKNWGRIGKALAYSQENLRQELMVPGSYCSCVCNLIFEKKQLYTAGMHTGVFRLVDKKITGMREMNLEL